MAWQLGSCAAGGWSPPGCSLGIQRGTWPHAARTPACSPGPWGARFAHCPMQGRMYGGGRMDTRRGHSPLELGRMAMRPAAFSTGDWKSFLNAHWGFSGEPGRMRPEPPLAPQAPGVLASFTALCRGRCMGMAPMGGGMARQLGSPITVAWSPSGCSLGIRSARPRMRGRASLLPRPLGYSLRSLPYAGADAWGWLRWGIFGRERCSVQG